MVYCNKTDNSSWNKGAEPMTDTDKRSRPLDQAAITQSDACLDLLRTGLYRQPEGGDKDAAF